MRISAPPAAAREARDRPVAGFLDWSAVEGATSLSRLSAHERGAWAAVQHPRRQRSWLAGRILAKYCFLRSFAVGGGRSPDRDGPELLTVEAGNLDAFSPWIYRQ